MFDYKYIYICTNEVEEGNYDFSAGWLQREGSDVNLEGWDQDRFG